MRVIRASRVALACVVALLLSQGTANARDDFMSMGVATTAPIGHHLFCLEHRDDCRPERGVDTRPIELDPALMRKVAEINTAINAAIKPESDLDLYGVEERWTFPADRGDCEDYALLKRRLLHQAGIAYGDLLMTVVRKKDGEGHAILTLRTRHGDFVLDNLDWRVRPWRETSYTYVKRQSVEDPARWIAVADGADVPVASLRR